MSKEKFAHEGVLNMYNPLRDKVIFEISLIHFMTQPFRGIAAYLNIVATLSVGR